MPFTLAHPAAVLPLIRRPFVASALVAGALAPDLLYIGVVYQFFTQDISGNFTLTFTHKFSSAFWVDPLLALALLVLFNVLARRPLSALAPNGLAARLTPRYGPPRLPSWSRLYWIVVSTIVGALTHVVWDSFTHGDGFFVRHWPGIFRAEVIAGWDVDRILQYVSTIGGCLLLVIWCYRWYRRTEPRRLASGDVVRPWIRWFMVVFTVLAAAMDVHEQIAPGPGGEATIRTVLTAATSGVVFALVWYVALWYVVLLLRRAHWG